MQVHATRFGRQLLIAARIIALLLALAGLAVASAAALLLLELRSADGFRAPRFSDERIFRQLVLSSSEAAQARANGSKAADPFEREVDAVLSQYHVMDVRAEEIVLALSNLPAERRHAFVPALRGFLADATGWLRQHPVADGDGVPAHWPRLYLGAFREAAAWDLEAHERVHDPLVLIVVGVAGAALFLLALSLHRLLSAEITARALSAPVRSRPAGIDEAGELRCGQCGFIAGMKDAFCTECGHRIR